MLALICPCLICKTTSVYSTWGWQQVPFILWTPRCWHAELMLPLVKAQHYMTESPREMWELPVLLGQHLLTSLLFNTNGLCGWCLLLPPVVVVIAHSFWSVLCMPDERPRYSLCEWGCSSHSATDFSPTLPALVILWNSGMWTHLKEITF